MNVLFIHLHLVPVGSKQNNFNLKEFCMHWQHHFEAGMVYAHILHRKGFKVEQKVNICMGVGQR